MESHLKSPDATGFGRIQCPLKSHICQQEPKVLSAEDIEKALLKSQKRRQLADEKRERTKRKTMERLLKKKDYKATVRANRLRPPQPAAVPMISWRSSAATGTRITFPAGAELPMAGHTKPAVVRAVIPCRICGAPKRYNCSRTLEPLCSLECYEQNNKLH